MIQVYSEVQVETGSSQKRNYGSGQRASRVRVGRLISMQPELAHDLGHLTVYPSRKVRKSGCRNANDILVASDAGGNSSIN